MARLHNVRLAAGIALCASAALAIAGDIAYVTVGDARNAADGTGYGAVSYEFRIGAHEVTNEQYCEFLNAVAATDTYGLYNPSMIITRSGNVGSYRYTTAEGAKPVTYVSWFDAVRFANWLHHGRPGGSQDATTTEDGAYTCEAATRVTGRNPGARVFLPTENEWYKAAYYRAGADAGYWEFPTQSGTPPVASAPNARANCANFDNMLDAIAAVAGYTASGSSFNTFDQAGNVWEWNETALETERVIRGGSWDDYALLLSAGYRDSEKPTAEYDFLGFRVAAGPAVQASFTRGNVNQDKTLDIADAIALLSYLFSSAATPACMNSADANDDGTVDLSDAVAILLHLFRSQGALPEPFLTCGPDPTAHGLGCMSFDACP